MDAIENAVIKSVWLEVNDYNCLTCEIEIEGEGWGALFGGFCLCNQSKLVEGKDYTGFYVRRLIDVILGGFGKFDSLVGQPCRVKTEDRKVVAIGHFYKDRWFEPRVELKESE